MMQSSTHKHTHHGLFRSISLLAPRTEHLLALKAYSGLTLSPSFGLISTIRHLVHVLKIILKLLTNAGKEGQSEDLLKNLFLTPEKENKMVIMQMCPPLMSVQIKTIFLHVFQPNHKSQYLRWPRKRILSYWCHCKAALIKLSLHCF